MKTSKQIIDITQLSRATLNNYISLGLIARPIVMNPGKAGGGARQLGYFPDDTIQRINTIRQLKSEGMYMGDIVNQMKQVNEVLADDLPAPEALKSAHGSGRALDGASLTVTVDQISHPAYMVNYNFEIVWFNEQARTEILGGFEALPPGRCQPGAGYGQGVGGCRGAGRSAPGGLHGRIGASPGGVRASGGPVDGDRSSAAE